jgi:uncharacterized protein with PQ loop repeat
MIPQGVAILAPLVNCLQIIPQVYKTYQTKRVKDLSLYTILLFLTTNLLWLLHGYFILDLSLLVSGVVNLTLNSILLSMYFMYQ